MQNQARGIEASREDERLAHEALAVYLSWKKKDNKQLEAFLQGLSAEQLDNSYPALARLLGLLLLTDDHGLNKYLPQHSLLVRDFRLAQLGYSAYLENDPAEMERLLKMLPYRSVFRDFAVLLKAATCSMESVSRARAWLNLIPDDSPYAYPAGILRVSLLTGNSLARSFVELPEQQQLTIAEIRQLDRQQLTLIKFLQENRNRLNETDQFNLAIEYQSSCETGVVQRFCIGLAFADPSLMPETEQHFLKGNDFEKYRVRALLKEKQENFDEAETCWRMAIRSLAGNEPHCNLKIALILRHIAQHQSQHERLETIIESLRFDPDDLDSYRSVLHRIRQEDDFSDRYGTWLEGALDRFPKEADLLAEAIIYAMSLSDYDCVRNYAEELSRIDPLNRVARQALFEWYVQQARKHIRSGNFARAEKEIEQAEQQAVGREQVWRSAMMRILCGNIAVFSTRQSDKLITGAKLQQDDLNQLARQFLVDMEAGLTGLPEDKLVSAMQNAEGLGLSGVSLDTLNVLIRQYTFDPGNRNQLAVAMEKIKTPLAEVLHQTDFPESELLDFCWTMDELGQLALLGAAALAGYRANGNPLFGYFNIYAETEGIPGACLPAQILKLHEYREQARVGRNHRARVLIDRYLGGCRQGEAELVPGLDWHTLGANMSGQDGPAAFYDRLPDKVFDKLDKRVASLLTELTPEQLAKEIEPAEAKSEKLLMAMMEDPELFSMLLYIRAAGELNLDTGVSLDDALVNFGLEP